MVPLNLLKTKSNKVDTEQNCKKLKSDSPKTLKTRVSQPLYLIANRCIRFSAGAMIKAENALHVYVFYWMRIEGKS